MSAQLPEIAGLERALEALRAGHLVVYPTETFYALGADPFSPEALERIFAVKGRNPQRPIALIAANAGLALALAREVPPGARRLARAFWPGPLTLVLPARAGLPPGIVGPDGGVGVRVSPHPAACALSLGFGRPITATSANLSGYPPPATLAAAHRQLGDKVKVYLEGGSLNATAPSTVARLGAGGLRMIRPGAVSERELRAALAAEALK